MARIASTRIRAILFVLVLLPLWASYLVKIYAWRIILAAGRAARLVPRALRPGRPQPGPVRSGDGHRVLLPLAAVHDPADLRRPRADPGVGARGVGRPRRPGLDDVPAGRAAARPAGGRGGLDLHVLADPRRLRHAAAHREHASSSATSSSTTRASRTTSRSRRPTRSSRSRSWASTCWGRAGSARSSRCDARALGRVAIRVATLAVLGFLYLPIASSRCTRSTSRAPRRGRSRTSRPTGSAWRSPTSDLRDALGPVASRSAWPPPLVALVLGTLAALALHRFAFFGRDADLVPVRPADRPAGHRDRHGPQRDDQRVGGRVLGLHDRRRPRDVLHRRRLQQRHRPPAPLVALDRGGVDGPGRRRAGRPSAT